MRADLQPPLILLFRNRPVLFSSAGKAERRLDKAKPGSRQIGTL